ncbi:MAG: GAF domain-containing protein [Phormidesmis sp.]
MLRKELALVASVIEAMDTRLCVHSAEGEYLLGNQQTFAASEKVSKEISTETSTEISTEALHKAEIVLEDEVIGWVSGSEKAAVAAALLSNLARRELEKRTITQELLSKYKEITLLFKLSEQIVETLDVDEIAQLVLDEAQQILPSDGGMLMLLHETTNILECTAGFSEHLRPQILQHAQTVKMGEGLLGKIAATGRGEIVDNVLLDERCCHLNTDPQQPTQKQSCHTLICTPLKIKDRLIGIITLYRLSPQPYRAEDFKLLTTLASHAAGVISVLRHEKQLKESRQNELIFQLAGQIRNSLSLPDTLQTAVHKVQSVLRLDRCFFLWHRAKSEIVWSSSSEAEDAFCEHFAIVSETKSPALISIIGTYSIEEVGPELLTPLYQQQVIKIDDVSQQKQFLADQPACSSFRRFLQQHSCEALLAFPLLTRTGQVGLLCCGSSQPRGWEAKEIDLLQAVSSQLIIAIDQTELYERSRDAAQLAEEKAEELEKTLSELKAVQLQLVQTEKMTSLGQMVAGIAHEINNPVTFIHGNLSHLEQNVKDLLSLIDCYQQEMVQPTALIAETLEDINLAFLTEDIPKLLDSMKMGTWRIREIVLSLRTFSQLDQAEYNQMDIHQGLDSALMLVQHRLQRLSAKQQLEGGSDRTDLTTDLTNVFLTKHYGPLPPVFCYANQLNQVFTHLINNALDALERSAQQPKRLTITTQQEDSQVIIRIADSGPGISQKIRHKIFDPFFTTKAVGEGTGLGLSISYQIITARHRGKLECHTKVGEGSEFVITLPIKGRPANPARVKSTTLPID